MSTPASYPREIVGRVQFCLWRREKRRPTDDEPTKVPYMPNGYRAASNDPTTWRTLSQCLTAFERGTYAGIGFFLAPPFIGVDLDDCRDPQTGIIVPRAAGIIRRHATYSEISPGLGGVKMLGTGGMPTSDGSGKCYHKKPWGTDKGGIEFYQRGRFFALTGNHLPDTPASVADITAPLASLYRELYPPQPPRRIAPPRLDVPETDRVRRAKAYMSRLPSSVSGEYGHSRLLHAACTLVRFGLDDTDALDLLHIYNRRAVPPWDEKEIERKLSEARKVAGHEAGSMLIDRREPIRVHRHQRRTILITTGAA